jgi:hypothetical protein|tara:strand:+ start:5826 stop:6473 length:648 start_codon:yes stop_codon:yes gene_type:complete
MIKDTIEDIRADLKSKRDALLIGHQNLKKDCDDWNKAIIVISLVSGLAESIKMRLELKGAGWTLLPIILSSITATMASLMKFRNFNQRMETYLQSASLLTNTLLKARNHKEVDEDLLTEYNGSLEKIETALYPNERKVFLKQAHKNLIEIMSQEIRYYDKIDKVNNHEISDDSSLSSDEKIMDESKARKNPLRELPAIQSKDVLDVLEEADEDKL